MLDDLLSLFEQKQADKREALVQTFIQSETPYVRELLNTKKQELQEKLNFLNENKPEGRKVKSASEDYLTLKIEQLTRIIERIDGKNTLYKGSDLNEN